MKNLVFFSFLALTAAARADIDANGFITYTQNGSDFTYDITLNNTGTTTIGTLWYAWIPGEDYLPIAPSSTSGPANWTFLETHADGFGYGLRWVAGAGSLIQPGTSLSGFSFTTTTTPSELLGNSLFGNHPPVGTTFIYGEGPFAGGEKQILINPVPEPATLLGLAAGVAFLRRRKR